jgi:hypothetical protein
VHDEEEEGAETRKLAGDMASRGIAGSGESGSGLWRHRS